ncbi:Similar to Endothelin-converting enzyme homolog (Locusta migratoria) [Cotesia congregata]|uniref:Similar to Endothelin-converting enzyme homolog (Locusta migratoria) n=1 Tax=Cotesia congregata TaxID=51543 RepID=A0A8J2HHK6_COTCN|nr:Similar to Endothelin-converting enzyme homolog (Locusta migratoria) [Cotesia congregata]
MCRQFDPVSGTISMNKPHDEPVVFSVESTTNLVPVKSRDSYFRRKKTSNRSGFILFALSLLVIGLLAGLLAIGVLYLHVKRSLTLCDSEECIRTAASFKESMDTTIDPCEDFYQYTCGRWSENHPTSQPDKLNSWFHERSQKIKWKIRDLLSNNFTGKVPWAVKQAKVLYNSCLDNVALDTLGLSPMLSLLEDLGLPRVPPAMGHKSEDFVKVAARARRILGEEIFIGFDVIPDPLNGSRKIILLDVPSSSSPLPLNEVIKNRLKSVNADKAKRSEDSGSAEQRSSNEKSYAIAVIKELMANGTQDSCDEDKISEEVDIVVKDVVDSIFELDDLLRVMYGVEDNSTLSEEDIKDENYMWVDDLQVITDEFIKSENKSLEPKKIWRVYLEELFKDIDDLDLDNKDKILVLLDVEVSYDPPSLHCAGVVNDMMGMAVSWLFVDRGFHNITAPNVIEMLEHIRAAFRDIVMRSRWIDNKTRLGILEKSNRMAYVIGYPEWLFREHDLNKYYEGIELKKEQYLKNILSITHVMTDTELKSLHVKNHTHEHLWDLDPTDVNAVYTFMTNHITLPAAILQFPFYKLGLEALNYGAIGAILGHELTHGFDNDGRHYDSQGNLRQWWSNETIDQYVDGELTLNENIADNGGLHEAVLAYRRWKAHHGQEPYLPGFTYLSHEQLLFLGFAHLWCEDYSPKSLKWMLRDSHSPGHVRLKAVLTNSKEFSDAWKCPVGSPMNPLEKCRVW